MECACHLMDPAVPITPSPSEAPPQSGLVSPPGTPPDRRSPAKPRVELFPLSEELAVAVNNHHRAVLASAHGFIDHVRKAGSALIQAKLLCPHGGWMDWLANHLVFSARTARVYMQIAAAWPAIEAQAKGSTVTKISEALHLLAAAQKPGTGDRPWPAQAPELLECGIELPPLQRVRSCRFLNAARRQIGKIIVSLDCAGHMSPNYEMYRGAMDFAKDLQAHLTDWRKS